MFDIGFAELIIIAVVSLLVIGPERLPGAVRTVSLWLGRFKRSFNEIRQEIEQELHNDAVLKDLKETSEQVRSEAEDVRKSLQQAATPLSDISTLADADTPAKDDTGETSSDKP
jgi:sec-independent protein translocase protein TatB